jgi:hypothetical protein
MADKYLDVYIAVIEDASGQTVFKLSSARMGEYSTGVLACDAVKGIEGDSEFRVFREIEITKSAAPTIIP